MVEHCRREFGRLDVVVNNAGMTHFVPHTDLEALSEDKWDEILAVNLKGPFFVCRAAIPLLQASGGGSIVNVASVAGLAGAGSSIAYAASKGGLITMTKSLARAFAPDIRVNAVCPGVILTRWLDGHEEMVEAAIKITPLKRASTTDDIADAITFLACDAGMMTGQALVIDGGTDDVREGRRETERRRDGERERGGEGETHATASCAFCGHSDRDFIHRRGC